MSRFFQICFFSLLVTGGFYFFSETVAKPGIAPVSSGVPKPPSRIPGVGVSDGKMPCYLCIYPDVGQPGYDVFKRVCDCMLEQKASVWWKAEVPLSKQAETQAVMQAICSTLEIDGVVHGPDDRIFQTTLRVCETVGDSCPIDLEDISCRTYADFEAFDRAIQSALLNAIAQGKNLNLKVCGNQNTNVFAQAGECKIGTVTTFSISTTTGEATTTLPDCAPSGQLCFGLGNQGGTSVCNDPANGGARSTQKCCLDGGLGYRVPPNQDCNSFHPKRACKTNSECGPSTCSSTRNNTQNICQANGAGTNICVSVPYEPLQVPRAGEPDPRCPIGMKCNAREICEDIPVQGRIREAVRPVR